MVSSASPHHDLAYATDRVGYSGRCLRCEAFIHMIVTGQNEICIVVVKRIPKGQAILVGTSTRTKQRNMPVGEGTKVRVSG